MNQFEYLSVLVSIIIGLGLSHLLSSAARLIQIRHRTRLYPPALIWMGILFLANIQIWWVGFDRRDSDEWHFFSFLLYLLIPIGASVLSYLVVPPLDGDAVVDLKASYHENRAWFFGLFGVLPLISLLEEHVRDDGLPWDVDVLFRIVFAALAFIVAGTRNERVHLLNALLALGLFFAYVGLLFLRLQ